MVNIIFIKMEWVFQFVFSLFVGLFFKIDCTSSFKQIPYGCFLAKLFIFQKMLTAILAVLH